MRETEYIIEFQNGDTLSVSAMGRPTAIIRGMAQRMSDGKTSSVTSIIDTYWNKKYSVNVDITSTQIGYKL